MQERHAVHQNAAAHQKHGSGTGHRKKAHQPRRSHQQASSTGLCQYAALAVEPQAQIIEFDDTGNQTIHPHSHQQGNTYQHRDLLRQGRAGDRAQGNDDDFRRENEISTDRALDLAPLERHHIARRIGIHGDVRGVGGGIVTGTVQEFVGQFLHAFVTQEGTSQHQERRDQPGQEEADGQGGGHQNHFIQQRPFGHRPHHRQLTVCPHTSDLLGIQRQIVAEYARRFFRCQFGHGSNVISHRSTLLGGHFGHHRHIVKNGGNIIEQGQQTGTSHHNSPEKQLTRTTACARH